MSDNYDLVVELRQLDRFRKRPGIFGISPVANEGPDQQRDPHRQDQARDFAGLLLRLLAHLIVSPIRSQRILSLSRLHQVPGRSSSPQLPFQSQDQ